MIQRDLRPLLIMALLTLLLSYVLSTYFAKRFTWPILRLVALLEMITYLDALRERITTTERNEYGELYDEVNTMLGRMEAAQQAQELAAVAFETQSGMVVTDAEQIILRVNRAFTEITGYTSQEVVGKTPAILRSGVQDEAFYRAMFTSLREHRLWSGEIFNKHKNGTVYPEHLTIQAVLDDAALPIYYVASFLDLTTQKESEAKLNYLEQFDALTGLANRERLVNKMQRHMDEDFGHGWGALICFDLNEFRLINEAYGHAYGDEVLQRIAERVQMEFKDSDLISRFGADEFALWFGMLDTNKEQATLTGKVLAELLITVLSQPFLVQGKTLHVTPSVGITLYDSRGTNAQELLKQADSALHQCKEMGKNFAFFDVQAEQVSLAHLDLHAQLVRACEEKQFELYYQSQHDLDGRIRGVEALIRWNHPERGLVSPLEFVPLAERTGQIMQISRWVISTACKQLADWQGNPPTADWSLAVNISAKEFMRDDFLPWVEETIAASGIRPGGLKFELTESLLIGDFDKAQNKMHLLRDLGIRLSLDDFGTGYSSLQYLRSLPLDQVKIDQSFVKGMLHNRSDIAIVRGVLQLGESLELEVIAEGVETMAHFDLLKSLGCVFKAIIFPDRNTSADCFVEIGGKRRCPSALRLCRTSAAIFYGAGSVYFD